MAAVLVVVLFSIVTAGGLGWLLGTQIFSLATELPKYRDNITARIQSARIPKGTLLQTADNLKQISDEINTRRAPEPAAPALGTRAKTTLPSKPSQVEIVEPAHSDLQYLLQLSTPVLKPLANVGLVIIFTIFMMIEQAGLRNRLLRLAGVKRLNQVTVALDDAAKRVSKYLLMQVLVNVGFGVLFAVGLYFIGIPNAVLWGTLTAILRIVPYVGAIISAAFPLILSLAIFHGWLAPVMVVVLVIALELIIGNFVEPMLYGAHTGLSPLAILVTTLFWTIVWGPAGLILATPLTVCVGVLGRYFPQLAFLHVLIGDEPVLEPPALFYQRLLAFDQFEAHEVAELFLKDHSLVNLYDSVFIPALAMAEHDRRDGSLTLDREQFMVLNLGEMVNEFAEHAAAQNLAAASTPDEQVPSGPGWPAKSLPGRILCLPAANEADSLAASMLAQLLEQKGFAAVSLPVPGAWRALHSMRPTVDDLICISALHPFSTVRSKLLSTRLQASFPGVPAIVGSWGFKGSSNESASQNPPQPISTLAAAVERVSEMKTVPESIEAAVPSQLDVPVPINGKSW